MLTARRSSVAGPIAADPALWSVADRYPWLHPTARFAACTQDNAVFHPRMCGSAFTYPALRGSHQEQ
jgi:hypothetical protein